MKVAKLERPFNNRIVGYGEEDVEQMLANPFNFRIHPNYQQQALAGSIDSLGFIRSVTVNKRTGHIIDGHLRVILASRSGVKSLPVEYVDLDEDEEIQALLSIDPIAALATVDKQKLNEVIDMVKSDDERVQQMLETIAIHEEIVPPVDFAEEWQGMPEFENEDSAYRTIYVHFKSQADVDAFAELVGQTITEETKYIWYPKTERRNLKHLGYAADE